MCAATNEPQSLAPAGDRSLAATERQLCRLEELAEIGMALARGLGRFVAEATEASPSAREGAAEDGAATANPFAGVDVALAYSRVARAVRQIVALEQQTLGLREARTDALQVKRRRERIQTIRRAVKARIEADHPDIERDDLDLLLSDLFLDYADYDDGTEGSEPETVARILKALQAELGEAEDGMESFAATADDDDPTEADRSASAETAPGWDVPQPPPCRWPGSPHLRANGHDPP